MTCQNCGAEIPHGQTTCPSCGAAVTPPAPGQPEQTPTAPAGPTVPWPPAQQPGQPAFPPPFAAGQPPAYLPYPYAAPPYGVPVPQARRPGKPVLVIVIAVFTFMGALGSLVQVIGGEPGVFVGVVTVGMASRLLGLIVGLVQILVGVGLILMSRWGWWLAILLCLLGALSSMTAVPHMAMLVETVMQEQPMPPPPEMMPALNAMVVVMMVLRALLQVAVIGYLLWRRDLFGIDVEPAAPTEEFGGPTAGFQ